MRLQRQVDGFNPSAIRFAVVGPRGAMSITAFHLGDTISGDISYHKPCFDHTCENTMEHGACDLLGEAYCHSSGRYVGEIKSLEDEAVFEYLERMYEAELCG
jgi:hypothetical protein